MGARSWKQPVNTDAVVFVVDDDQSVRDALSNLIRSVGLQAHTFDSGRDFLSYQRPDAAACLVLDVRLPGLSGLDLQRELAAAGEQIPIIFITGHGDIPMTVRAMKAGAAEFLPKPFREQDLLDAIQQALAKDWQAREQRAELSAIRDRYETLTGREREVMAQVVRGLLNKQIAAELGISEKTVKFHRGRVMDKTQAGSVAELVRQAEKIDVRLTRPGRQSATAAEVSRGPVRSPRPAPALRRPRRAGERLAGLRGR